MRPPFPLPLALLGALLVTACRDSSSVSYRIPKENDAPPPVAAADPHAGLSMPGADMASTAVPQADGSDLQWTAPAAWQSRPASAMRKASYAVGGDGGATADVSVTAFPGEVGGELANINRWRSQLGLPPIADAELAGAVTHLDQNGLHLTIMNAAGAASADRQRILGAIVPFGPVTWFFKITGPDAVVAGAHTDFMALLETVRAAVAGPPAVAADMTSTPVTQAGGSELKWKAPAEWQEKPASAMRKASYAVTGADSATGDISITAFPGDVGGELANVNRWRNQLSLPPLAESELAGAVTRREQNGLQLTIVELTGAGNGMLGAIVPFDGSTWFFKLTGPAALVAREKDSFLKFLGTIEAP